MKKLFVFIVLITSISFAHKQHVHQYITREAYKLLKLQLGFDIPLMQLRIGDGNPGSQPWEKGTLTTGAWREDSEDVVYKYSKYSAPTITGPSGTILSSPITTLIIDILGVAPDAFVSSTHFWYSDDGDNISSTIRAAVEDLFGFNHAFQFTVPNAMQKMHKYSNGNYIVDENHSSTAHIAS